MNTQLPEHIRNVYFMGIGGIGMSALARYFKWQGTQVEGYDSDRSALCRSLEMEGIPVHYTVEESLLPVLPDLVVYTPAIPDTHEGMQYYRRAGIPVVKRAQVLGHISRKYRCIAVAGTHGKTTTSGLITWAMQRCGIDVTAFLGGLIPDLGGNFVHGSSDWLVVEADEYDRSFLTLSPEVAVVTAMDPDHLDIYGDLKAMIDAYLGFLGNVRPGGVMVLHSAVAGKISKDFPKSTRLITYGDPGSDYVTGEVARKVDAMEFNIERPGAESIPVSLRMPGRHNALNATAAMAVCVTAGLDIRKAAAALGEFSGIRRRLEVVYADQKLTVIDDYAHHPEELKAAIEAVRMQYPGRRVTGVFQPHLYSRTRDFHLEFAAALDALDVCVLVELYPARELPIEGVNSEMIYKNMKNQDTYLTSKAELTELLLSMQPEVLLFLGAGDLDRMIPDIVQKMKRS